MTGLVERESVSDMLSAGQTFLTCAGVETFLLFQQEFPLREFCAFEVLEQDRAWQALQDGLLKPAADVAAEYGCGVITDTLTWRASVDYVRKLGYDDSAVATINRRAIEQMRAFVREWQRSSDAASRTPVILSAEMGPRGDGYARADGDASALLDYHREQVELLAASGVDMITAATLTSVSEAVGIARAARDNAVPLIVSPTIETDGSLPDGTRLGDFVESVDAATGGYPLFYMVNCAHPTHIEPTLAAAAERKAGWLDRFRGLRANASAKSHAELDNSTILDRGDIHSLATAIADLQQRFDLTVVGGCCGTDAEHLGAIAGACVQQLTR